MYVKTILMYASHHYMPYMLMSDTWYYSMTCIYCISYIFYVQTQLWIFILLEWTISNISIHLLAMGCVTGWVVNECVMVALLRQCKFERMLENPDPATHSSITYSPILMHITIDSNLPTRKPISVFAPATLATQSAQHAKNIVCAYRTHSTEATLQGWSHIKLRRLPRINPARRGRHKPPGCSCWSPHYHYHEKREAQAQTALNKQIPKW